MSHLDSLLHIAQDLTANLAAKDRYVRLLHAARAIIPFDAACLLHLQPQPDRTLVPLAGIGLRPTALNKTYRLNEHPRLDAIAASLEPVRFPANSPLPDPFDGALEDERHDVHGIHSCMGCPLYDGDQLVGLFTADAMNPKAFDALDQRILATLGALAGAALRTSLLIDSLEHHVQFRTQIARETIASQRQHRGTFIGSSPAVQESLRQVDAVAGTDVPVLITGETGTGKELIAHLIHKRSRRHDEAIIEVNCAALPSSLAESELFGHAAGAFTGAGKERLGKFALADGGTLFLDEIGELPLSLQASLLRVLQSGEIQRPGSDRPMRCDVRIIAATNRNLQLEIQKGRFREDLFHRLSVFPIHLAPLRNRRSDIPLLASHFAELARIQIGLGSVHFSQDAMDLLVKSSWAGNVRELANVVQRGVLLARQPDHEIATIQTHHIPHQPILADYSMASEPFISATIEPDPTTNLVSLRDRVDIFQRRCIEQAVANHVNNWAAAARSLGMHRANLHQLAKRLGIR